MPKPPVSAISNCCKIVKIAQIWYFVLQNPSDVGVQTGFEQAFFGSNNNSINSA